MSLHPYDPDRLWIKARMFVHRAMDDGREFDEQAFWASAAFELLGKAALAKVSPILIANPNPDGHSLLVASGLLEVDDKFFTIPAKALWSRCHRAFKPFNEQEAAYISSVRNDYLHAGGVGREGTPEAWWPRYWAQVAILVSHLDRDLEELVGRERERVVTQYLETNRENVKRRAEALIERARSRLALHESGSMSVTLERAWAGFSPYYFQHTTSAECPACGSSGTLSGDTVLETKAEFVTLHGEEDQFEDVIVFVTVATDGFACPRCHLELNDLDLIEAVGLDTDFEVEGDPSSYYEPEYDNE
ncbi:MAG: hypothetical protein BGO95_04195 [Micrococcales bacterium 73-13]|nr:MAG: hypothetical protein BGO95_04195 [Micrococcales bacterium 73-13]